MKRPQPQPAHTRYLSSPAEATIHGKIEGFVLRLPPQNKAHATFMQPLQCVLQHHVANPNVSTHTATEHDNNHAAIPNAICNHRFKKRIKLRTQEQPLVSEHRGGTHYARNDRSRNRRTHEVPFIRAAATLHGKMQGFVLRLPPQNKAHATFMQPLQYVSQHHVANLHLSTHMATPDDNNHAATPMRSATIDSRNA